MKREAIYHQLSAFFFLAAFVAQTFSNTFVIADYYSNKAKYAANCENKARPQMNCNGKCVMVKKLQQEEKKDGQNPERKGDNKNEITLSLKTNITTLASFCETTVSLPESPVSSGKSTDRSLHIFRPPRG